MFTYRRIRIPTKTLLFSWQFLAIKMLLLALLAVWLEKPAGSLEGHISMEMKGFGMQTYDMRGNHVYALVNGPRGGPEIERAAWVHPDGTFKLDHLPVGEYSLRVRARGFQTVEQYSIYVYEGKVTSLGKNIAMHILNPEVTIGLHSRTYTSVERPALYFNTTGAVDGTVKIYKTDMISLLKGPAGKQLDWSYNLSLAKNTEHPFVNPLAKTKPLIERSFKLEQDYTDNSRAEILLDDKLPAGDYVAYAQVKGVNGVADDIAWFTISDIGLVIKRDSDMAIARAIDLVTLKPVSNCKIETWDESNRTKVSGPFFTGADGVVRIPLNGPAAKVINKDVDISGSQLLFIGSTGQQRTYGDMSASGADINNYDTYFYTDRPVYRLGQTVYFKGLLRQSTVHGLVNPGGNHELDAAIENPDNNEVWHGKLKTTSHGTFNGSFVIPADDKTGGYQVRFTYPDGNTGYGSFEVDEYRKPEYQVDMTPLTPRVVMGEKAQAKLHASYYFGAPVANANVKYTITVADDWFSRLHMEPRPDYYDYFDDWEGSYDQGYGGGEQVAEGTATTDGNGDAIITFDTKAAEQPNPDDPTSESNYNDKRYNIQATVTDLSRLTVDGGTSVSAVPGDFMLFVNPGSYVVQVGDKMDVSVMAKDYDGKPVANQAINVKVRRWQWDHFNHKLAVDKPVADLSLTTGLDGTANMSMYVNDKWPSDTFYIAAVAKDKGNRTIKARGSIWVANYAYPYVAAAEEAEAQTLSIKLDKDVYKPGDVAKVMVSAPLTGKEGADAIVTVEGMRIYNYKVVPMSATAKLIEIPITKEYAPNIFVDVALVGNKHQFYTAEQMIKVSPLQNFLSIRIATDKERYHPGDKAKYTLTVSHADGTPAANTELSLGLVDESIYAIRGEMAGDIKKHFYSRRENKVLTVCSFPETYTGGPDKIEPRVRKDFKDTAAWLPDLVTDKNGIATAEIKLPDNLTTWRATVRGIDMATMVGSAVSKVISTQDFILRLALPRFFSQGDQALITAVVHNYTKQKQDVTVSLTTSSQFKVNEKKTQVLKIDPEKASRYSWPVTITASGTGVIGAKAVGQTAGDAMEVKLPIRALGLPAFTVKSGLLTEDKQTVEIPVGLSSDADKSTVKGKLTVASSTIGPVLGNFDQLIEYPYGCTEQTMSRLVPSIVAMQLHKQLNVPVSPENLKKFAEVQKIAFKKLEGYHHSDGGWGWWAEDQSNPYLTCYVVQGLSMLKASGYKVDDAFITGGMSWLAQSATLLQKQFADPHKVPDEYGDYQLRTDLARMVYTLSLWSATPEELVAQQAQKVAAKPGAVAKPGAAKAGKKKPAKLTYSIGPDLFVPAQGTNSGPLRESKVRSWLLNNIKVLSPEALSYLTLSCKKMNDQEGADKAYKQLTYLANSGKFVNWEHSSEMIDKMFDTTKSHWSEYDYRFTGVESTALALKSVLTMEPDNHDKIESIKQWLLWQRDANGWENTKTTSEVFLVLLQEELQFKAGTETNFTFNVTEGAKQLMNAVFDFSTSYKPETVTPIPVGAHDIMTLTKDGPGRLYYTSLITYFRHMLPGDRSVAKAVPEGLSIKRKFYRLAPIATTTDGVVHFQLEEITDGHIKAGETIMMKVLVDAPLNLPYIKVEAALPSGAEVVAEDARQNSTDSSTDDTLQGYWGSAWWNHQDILDDRIVYFGTNLAKGKSEFHTMLRMELPGTLEINPVSLEGMYSDKIKGYSMFDSLQVTE
jgi:alpha-2-macroglobulin